VPLLVDLRELLEGLRIHFARWIDASLVERAGTNGVLQIIEDRVSFGLAADPSIRPLLETHAHMSEAHPPRVLASIAGAPFVVT
jgi:hypothetical protein